MANVQQWAVVLMVVVAMLGAAALVGVAAATAPGDTDQVPSIEDPNETADASEAAATFEITQVETNDPIKAGETAEVTVHVHNVGEQSATKNVWFYLGEHRKDELSVELDAGESTTVALSYVSKSGDADDWTLIVSTPDDEVQMVFTIEEPWDDSGDDRSDYTAPDNFTVVEFEPADSVKAGEELRLHATVRNSGQVTAEKLVWFTIDDSTVNETIVELGPEAERTVTYVYETSEEAGGDYSVSAVTPDDRADRSVHVEPLESEFRIDEVSVDSQVTAEEWIDAEVTLTNVGDISGMETVTLDLEDDRIDEAQVELDVDESTTITLSYRTNERLTGDLNFSVATDGDSEQFVVTVAEPESTTTDDSDGGSDDIDESTPGFGIVASLLALLLFGGALARRRV